MDRQSKLGTGRLGLLLLSLAVRSIIAQLVNGLYNIVDRIYRGEHVALQKLTIVTKPVKPILSYKEFAFCCLM